MADKFQLKAIISAVDKLTPTLAGIRKSAKITQKSLLDIKNASGTLLTSAGITGAAVAGGIFASVKKIVDVSAQFERFQTILETVEGSSEKAKSSMAWVEEFAKKTPYELTEVMDSFVRLRAYGIDPTDGTLRTLGDTAAAMGKPVMSAVEALADALTGENERLKEFGITARKTGNQIAYTFTNKLGEQMTKRVQANNRAMIQSTLSAIWNEKYGGAADRLSATWDGMWSNLMDSFTGFIRKIGAAGFFDSIKKQLSGVLTTLNKMADDGSLQKIAEQISADLVEGLKALVKWVASVDWKAFFNGVKETIVTIRDFIKAIGGVKTILISLGVMLLAGPLAAITTIIGAVWRLRLAFVALGTQATASGAAVAGSFGTSAAASMASSLGALAKNAGLLGAAATVGWGIGTAISSALSDSTKDKIGETIARILALFGNDEAARSLEANGATKKQIPGRNFNNFAGLSNKTQLNGEMTVRFENAPPGMRVDQGKTNQAGVAMNPDVGYRQLAFGL